MAPQVDVINKTRRRVDDALLSRAGCTTLAEYGAGDGELCVTVVGARRMRELNRQYHGRSELTDVLAFSQEEGDTFPGEPAGLGDVVLSWDAAARQAGELGHSVQTELAFLTAHGVLHLLGHDDDTTENRREMLAKQGKVLRQLGCTFRSSEERDYTRPANRP